MGFLAEWQEVEEGMWEVVQNLEVHKALGSLQSLGEHHQVIKRWIQVQPHEVARWHVLQHPLRGQVGGDEWVAGQDLHRLELPVQPRGTPEPGHGQALPLPALLSTEQLPVGHNVLLIEPIVTDYSQ